MDGRGVTASAALSLEARGRSLSSLLGDVAVHKRKAAFDSLLGAGFNEKPSLALVALMPDMEALEHCIALQMSEMKSSLISWMVGIFLTFMTVIGSLLFGLRAWLPHTAQ